jgi:DNA-binding NarL/FixJ family response regulator
METRLRASTAPGPTVVLTDIGLPGMDGIEGTRHSTQFSRIPILALTVYDDDEKVFSAICAGASGYLLKNTPPARLLESIGEVAAGGAPMSPEIARRSYGCFASSGRPRPPRTTSRRRKPRS